MSKKMSPQISRTIFFVLGVICYAIGYVFLSEKSYGGSFSRLITIVGMFLILNSFTYKTKESELKLHALIQKGTKEFSEKAFLRIMLISIMLFIVIASIMLSKIIKQEYVGRSDYVISFIIGLPLLFSYSLWEKWKLLKANKST